MSDTIPSPTTPSISVDGVTQPVNTHRNEQSIRSLNQDELDAERPCQDHVRRGTNTVKATHRIRCTTVVVDVCGACAATRGML